MTLATWIKNKLKEYKLSRFYYLAFIDNVEGIIKNGILSLNEIKRRKLKFKSFAEKTVQQLRHTKEEIQLTNNKFYNIHELVPVYLTPKTPTLFARRKEQDRMFFAVIQSFVIADNGIEFAFSDGNAASKDTRFYYSLKNLDMLPWEVINTDYWVNFDDGKRKRNSEFFIYPRVPIKRIEKFVVNNSKSELYIENIKQKCGIDIPVEIGKSFFFD